MFRRRSRTSSRAWVWAEAPGLERRLRRREMNHAPSLGVMFFAYGASLVSGPMACGPAALVGRQWRANVAGQPQLLLCAGGLRCAIQASAECEVAGMLACHCWASLRIIVSDRFSANAWSTLQLRLGLSPYKLHVAPDLFVFRIGFGVPERRFRFL